jgi:hypothetical protein
MHSACVPGLAPLAIGRAILAPPLLPLARLGHIGATAQHCSPLGGGGQGAATRDRRGVLLPPAEQRISRLLVKSPPGLGKTTQAIECAIRYQAEQEGKDGGRLFLGDFNEAGVPAQTSIFVRTAQLRARRRCDDDDADDSAERRRHFNPKQANILICDEDPTVSLVEQGRLSAEDIPGSARMGSGDDPCGPSSPGRPTDLLARPRRLRGPAS